MIKILVGTGSERIVKTKQISPNVSGFQCQHVIHTLNHQLEPLFYNGQTSDATFTPQLPADFITLSKLSPVSLLTL